MKHCRVERIPNGPPPTSITVASLKYGQEGYIGPWEYDYSSASVRGEAPVFSAPHSVYNLKVKKGKEGKVALEFPEDEGE